MAVRIDELRITDGEARYAGPFAASQKHPRKGTLRLRPQAFSDDDVFYAPSIIAAQALYPTLFDDAATFYSPTIQRGAVTLSPTRISADDAFHSPYVAVAVEPSRFDDADAFYLPIVSSVAFVSPQLFSDADAFYSPQIHRGIAPQLFVDADAFYSPTVQRGDVTLTPQAFSDADAFFSPIVSGDEFDDYWYDVVLLAGFDEDMVDESLCQWGPADAHGVARIIADAPLVGDASLILPAVEDYASWSHDARLSVADSSDKTIEFRFRLESLDADRPLVDKGEYRVEVLADGTLRFRTYVDGNPDAEITSPAGTISAGVQHYVALCRQAGTWKMLCGSGSTVDLVGSDAESATPTLMSDHALTIG